MRRLEDREVSLFSSFGVMALRRGEGGEGHGIGGGADMEVDQIQLAVDSVNGMAYENQLAVL